ncbi:MAG: peptidase S51 [Tenericutes bacterium HGW-Tenericutes-3]|nr:MAG: peptidase S51 [Tenericutes bacterium HGW-Tenericutes-3]
MMVNILLSRGIIGHDSMIEHFKPYIKESDQVVIVALSHFPSYTPDEKAYNDYYEKGGEYYQKMVDSFKPYGVSENQIKWVHYFKDDQKSAIEKIKNADIVYFPGGAPDLMMMRIKAFGIKETLEAHQGVFIGSSAGAMIQMKAYHISPDFDYPSFRYEEGLDLLKGFSVEVHYRRRKKQKAALRKVHRAYKHPIYAIPDEGAIIVTQESINCIWPAQALYTRKGVVKK